MIIKCPPRIASAADVIVRWCFYSLIIGWGVVLTACVVQFLRT